MILTILDRKFKVWWKHEEMTFQPVKMRLGEKVKLKSKANTQCFIQLVNDNIKSNFFYGQVECSPEDVFSKRKGRRLSFERALGTFSSCMTSDIKSQRDFKKRIWEQYKSQLPKDLS